MSNKSPNISTPKGGGALSGMGEKFSPDLFTGTGNFSVPIALPPGRNGFQPELTIGYSTGGGNNIFGLGWNLGIPGIMRKTNKGIPVYDDGQDIFILSGAEDLLCLKTEIVVIEGVSWQKKYFRPRTEGLFARIIHHTKSSGENYWQVKSKDGLISYYGNPTETENHSCVIAKPDYRTNIFAWKLYKTIDPFGNEIVYEYIRDIVNLGIHQYDQLYLSKIKYVDYLDSEEEKRYLLSVKFSYQERTDAFSEYKSGFEIRTIKRCNTIEIFSHPLEGDLPEGYDAGSVTGNEELNFFELDDTFFIRTKTYDFKYLDEISGVELPLNMVSLLHSVIVIGHDINDDPENESMPPLTFDYSKFNPQKRDFYPIRGKDLPSGGLGSASLELVDLTGNGLPDILQMDGVVRWWRNKGNGEYDVPRFMKDAPAGLQLDDPNVQMIDANGDGRADLLVNKPGFAGYFSSRFGGTWDQKSFQKYDNIPSFSFEDPEVKLMDMDGDGVTDVLRNGSRLEIFFNHPKKGFYKHQTINKKQLDDFPNLSFTDPRIKMASMSGNLQDMVMIYSGGVCYWPHMGYGKYGKKIIMKNSPRLPNGFNTSRILLGDVDGDGLSDFIYIDNNKVTLWINQSGNSWSDPIEITGTPAVTDVDNVRLVDLLGTGVSGILWSSVRGSSGLPKMYFLDFTAGNKPYLLQEMNNKMGSITRVQYTSSINFFLEDDKHPKTRWKSELPFPVQVVSKVEVIDELSKGKLATEYSYHHGYWDGAEREFRGFGRVDQRDTESFSRYNTSSLVDLVQTQEYNIQSTTYLAIEEEHYTPPTETRTWFHQGPLGDEFGAWHETDYSNEFWDSDLPFLNRNDLVNSIELNEFNGLERRAKRDALRTMRGTVLRTELYAYTLDGSILQNKPYTVTESISFVKEIVSPLLSRKDDTFKYSSSRIFFPYQIAQRTTQWECGSDPMTSFSFTENYDDYGQAHTQISIAIPRGKNYRIEAGTSQDYLATRSDTEFIETGAIDEDETQYMQNRVSQSKAFDYTNDDSDTLLEFKNSISSETATHSLIAHSLNFYDGSEFVGEDFGVLGDYGALTKSETLLLTPGIVSNAYGGLPLTLDVSPSWTGEYPSDFQGAYPTLGGYVYNSGGAYTEGYYLISAQNQYDFHVDVETAKGLILQSKDPFEEVSTISYDDYKLLPETVTDAQSNVTIAEYDYRVMQPNRITDINDNISVFDFSPLGLLRATAIIGKGTEGDYKSGGGGYYDQFEPSTILEYDFFNFIENGDPVWVKTTKREHHYADSINDDTIISIEYSDGFGRLLQTRTQAEDIIFGEEPEDRIFGSSSLPASQSSNDDAIGIERDGGDPLNVVVSGWQVYNNKGKVVEKYEPFFASGFDYEPPE